MYKILIDLDVITIAFWNKKDARREAALKFIKRVKDEEFMVFTPLILIKYAALVLITSIFDINYLITFNRKHLKNNKDKINEVLKRNGLKEVNIVLPEEV